MPWVRKKEFLLYGFDKNFIVSVLRNLNSDVPVNWQIRNNVINGIIIAEQSQGRIYINMKNQLVIKKLRFADGNIYRWEIIELKERKRIKKKN